MIRFDLIKYPKVPKWAVVVVTLAAVAFGMSFSTDRPPEDGEYVPVSRAGQGLWKVGPRGLAWLASRQRADGFWGDDDHCVTLTSLVLLAFLHHDEAPGSGSHYSNCLEKGTTALVNEIKNVERRSLDEHALSIGVLAEIYECVHVPFVRAVLEEQLATFKPTEASPWQCLAADALDHSRDLDLRMAGCQQLALLDAHTLTNSATATSERLLLHYLTSKQGSPRTMGLSVKTELDSADFNASAIPEAPTDRLARVIDVQRAVREAFRRHLEVPEFTPSKLPAATVYVTGRLAYQLGGDEWQRWTERFRPAVLAAQCIEGERGWWTAASLGSAKDPQTEGMTEEDASIYTTSLMLMTIGSLRRDQLPSFRIDPFPLH